MPDVLLFGATGYTGRLTARALRARNADFVIAGRDAAKLERLARYVDPADVRIAEAGDAQALERACRDVKVLCTTVGPFTQLGDAAVTAALRAGVHYLDCTGEASFIERLLTNDAEARAAGIAMAPAMGFDEVPSDVGLAVATEGLEKPDVIVSVAFPSHGSSGTIKTIITNISGARGTFIENGRPVQVRSGSEVRWAPMPPPLGPRQTLSFPLAETKLAPLHVDLNSFKTFLTVGRAQRYALRYGAPFSRAISLFPGVAGLLDRVLPSGRGPSDEARTRSKFTILVEARSGDRWRNVALQGADVYGLTAELLALGALKMAEPGYSTSGVVAPTQAVPVDDLQKALLDLGVSIDTYSYDSQVSA